MLSFSDLHQAFTSLNSSQIMLLDKNLIMILEPE